MQNTLFNRLAETLDPMLLLTVLVTLFALRIRSHQDQQAKVGFSEVLINRLTREQFYRLSTMVVNRLTWAFVLLMLVIVGWMLLR